MVFTSDHKIHCILSIHGLSEVKPNQNDDVIYEQPLKGPYRPYNIGLSCLYILKKVEVCSGVTDVLLTDSQRDNKI